MLPEQYCNFLLALYTNGQEAETIIKQDSLTRRFKNIERFQVLLLYLLLPISFVVIYFTEFHVYLQLLILALLLSYALWGCFSFKDKKRFHYHAILMISLFLILLFTITFSDWLFGRSMITNIVIAGNFMIWMVLGLRFQMKFMKVIGLIGMIFVIIYYFV